MDFVGGTEKGKLALIRSFDIPTGSSHHGRLNNLSWTYDNALAAIAFIDADAKSQAEQILDQLSAVQLTDGSLDFAYVQAGPYAYFIEGLGDTRIPIDVQSLGAMYLKLRGDARGAGGRVPVDGLLSRRPARRRAGSCSARSRSTRPPRPTSSGARARSRPMSRCTGWG